MLIDYKNKKIKAQSEKEDSRREQEEEKAKLKGLTRTVQKMQMRRVLSDNMQKKKATGTITADMI